MPSNAANSGLSLRLCTATSPTEVPGSRPTFTLSQLFANLRVADRVSMLSSIELDAGYVAGPKPLLMVAESRAAGIGEGGGGIGRVVEEGGGGMGRGGGGGDGDGGGGGGMGGGDIRSSQLTPHVAGQLVRQQSAVRGLAQFCGYVLPLQEQVLAWLKPAHLKVSVESAMLHSTAGGDGGAVAGGGERRVGGGGTGGGGGDAGGGIRF